MLELLSLTIGAGLGVSLLFTELFGLAAGGMVVPGYAALYLDQPAALLLTLGASWVTFLGVHALSSVVVLYGRRLTAATILMGYMVGMVMREVMPALPGGETLALIGFIIPGLIALWFYRQGVVETTAAILVVAITVRLALVAAGVDLTLS